MQPLPLAGLRPISALAGRGCRSAARVGVSRLASEPAGARREVLWHGLAFRMTPELNTLFWI
jgi:hypothetical protein